MDAKEDIKELNRRISELGESARSEADPVKKAELVESLRVLLTGVATRTEEQRQEYYAALGEEAPALDVVVDQHLKRILDGEQTPLPEVFRKFPAAKGGAD